MREPRLHLIAEGATFHFELEGRTLAPGTTVEIWLLHARAQDSCWVPASFDLDPIACCPRFELLERKLGCRPSYSGNHYPVRWPTSKEAA